MGKNRRTSDIFEKAKIRAAGISTIGKDLDLGNGLTLEGFNQLIERVGTGLDRYNALRATIDEEKNKLDADEKKLIDAYTQALMGVGAKYGKDSSEYEKAGGVRKSERKSPVRKLKTDGSKADGSK